MAILTIHLSLVKKKKLVYGDIIHTEKESSFLSMQLYEFEHRCTVI